MFNVKEMGALGRKSQVAEFGSFAEAEAYIVAAKPVCFEPDADNPGCADAFMRDGRLLAIEPVGFKGPAA